MLIVYLLLGANQLFPRLQSFTQWRNKDASAAWSAPGNMFCFFKVGHILFYIMGGQHF